jgi:hypothetical protein
MPAGLSGPARPPGKEVRKARTGTEGDTPAPCPPLAKVNSMHGRPRSLFIFPVDLSLIPPDRAAAKVHLAGRTDLSSIIGQVIIQTCSRVSRSGRATRISRLTFSTIFPTQSVWIKYLSSQGCEFQLKVPGRGFLSTSIPGCRPPALEIRKTTE